MSQVIPNERSLRSVFVGNIPYDASEEKLKDIFSEVGTVHCFKLVYDRESGKPKGYGFCEYGDQATAQSAMRNLNGYELNGRALRVDCATNERFKDEMKYLQVTTTGSAFETPYGQDIDPEKAPETIAKIITSYPPEQMFDLVRNLKACALTNQNETRNMLLQNPQLAYALLQALVVMKCVDINQAASMLYRPNIAPVVIPPANVGPVPGPPMGMVPPPHMMINQTLPIQAQPPPMMQPVHQPWAEHQPPDAFNRGPMPAHSNFDQRHMDPRLRDGAIPSPPAAHDPRTRGQAIDPRMMPQTQTVPPNSMPPVRGPAPIPMPVPGSQQRGPPPPVPGPGSNQTVPPTVSAAAGQNDQEKAQLIIQVLSLTDQQIAMLPQDQRQQIMLLKEQLSRSGTN